MEAYKGWVVAPETGLGGKDHHPYVRVGIGNPGEEPEHWLEVCATCLSAAMLEQCYCCAEHAAGGLAHAWLGPQNVVQNRKERREHGGRGRSR